MSEESMRVNKEGNTGKKNKKEKKKRTVLQEILSWVWTILSALVIVFVIRTFIFEPIRVDGTSMTNTLKDNEFLFCSKIDYLLGDIDHGDIVICNYPGRTNKLLGIFTEKTRFVKRVVGMPGDTVAIVNGVVYVNGEVVPDPENIATKPWQNFPYYGGAGDIVEWVNGAYQVTGHDTEVNPYNYPIVRLTDDQYLVVGDNRATSHDSRATDVGPISRDMILGKVRFVFFPFSAIRSVYE